MTIGKYFALGLIGLLVFGSISPIWATSDLSVNLNSVGTPVKPNFKFLESAFIEYPNGGKLKDLLAGKNYTISFVEDSTNTSVQDLINKINAALVHDQKSPVIVTDLTVKYTATLTGDEKSTAIDYDIELNPTITSYVITKGTGDQPTIIDAAWMGLAIKEPVVIKTAEYGDIEINNPISFVKKDTPDVYSAIAGTKAEDALKNNLIDANSILQVPIDQWNRLFDPAFIISETSSFGYKGQKVVLTTFAMGQSTIGQTTTPTQNTVDFTTDTNYKLTTVQHASSATVNIDGQAITTKVGDTPAFATTPRATTYETSSGGFPVGVIYAMAAFGAIVAGAILFWSNRKLKQAANTPKDTSPSRPMQYEERQHWADKFDDDKKTPKP